MIEDIFKQAQTDALCTRLIAPNSISYIYKGIKIENKDGDIKIYNTKIPATEQYEEVSPDQYEVFFEFGFRIGAYNVCIFNYHESLDEIQRNICNELTSRNNQKHYKSMKNKRLYIMNKYTEILKLK